MTGQPTIERRQASEWRLAARRIEGYAAVFNSRATIADFEETVAPGAFTETLQRRGDVLALVDHDPRRLLGRTKSGTLRLAQDTRGLHFEVDLAETQLSSDMLALMARGDIGGASFAFTVPPKGDRWEGRNRTLLNVNLIDVSIVQSFPAYPETTVMARSLNKQILPLALARRYMALTR
jgi:uncharacterized protein